MPHQVPMQKGTYSPYHLRAGTPIFMWPRDDPHDNSVFFYSKSSRGNVKVWSELSSSHMAAQKGLGPKREPSNSFWHSLLYLSALGKTWLQCITLQTLGYFFFTFLILYVYRHSFGSLQGVLGAGAGSATGKLPAILVPVAINFQNTSSELLGAVNTLERNWSF